MKSLYKKHPKLWDNMIWLGWALGYAFCFPTYNASPLIWVIFAPILVYIYRQPIQKTIRYAFIYSIVFWLVTLFWLVAFHEASLPFFAPGYAMYTAFFIFLFAYFAKKVKKLRWLMFPMIWTSLELLRSVGYLGFQWNLIGNTLWKSRFMLQSADIWGVWGVGFIVLLVNSVLAEVLDGWMETQNIKKAILKHKKLVVGVGILLVANLTYGIITFYHYKKISDNSPKERLALMQPNIGSHEPWWNVIHQTYITYWKMHAEAALKNPDIFVWSETMVRHRIWDYRGKPQYSSVNKLNERFIMMPYEFDTPILIAHPEKRDSKLYNSVDYIDPKDGMAHPYGKIHLCPFGEWMPFYEKIPIARDILRQAGAAAYTPATDFKIFKSRKGKFAAMICFEDLFALLARRYVKKGVNYFLNSTNDGWAYRWKVGTALPLWQHVAGIIPMAISVRRPIARAVNTGVTGIIDITGKMSVSPVPLYERGVFVDDISIIDENIQTLYVRFGFMFPYIILFLTFLTMIYTVFFHKEKFDIKEA